MPLGSPVGGTDSLVTLEDVRWSSSFGRSRSMSQVMTQIQQIPSTDTELTSAEDIYFEAARPSSQQELPASLHSVPDRAPEKALKLWEYQAIFGGASTDHAVQMINGMGDEGWELVAVVPAHDPAGQTALYLKRELRA